MQGDNEVEEIDKVFFNKKDTEFCRLQSKFDFFDLFSISNEKCQNIRIPETILLEPGKKNKSLDNNNFCLNEDLSRQINISFLQFISIH